MSIFFCIVLHLQTSTRASTTTPTQNAPQLRPRTPYPRAPNYVFPSSPAWAENSLVGIRRSPAGRGGSCVTLKTELSSCLLQQGAGHRDRGTVLSCGAPALPPAPVPPSPQTAPLPLHGKSPTPSIHAYVSINEKRKSLLNKVGMRLMLLASYL